MKTINDYYLFNYLFKNAPLRPHCREAPGRDSNLGWDNLEAGTLTNRPPYLLVRIYCTGYSIYYFLGGDTIHVWVIYIMCYVCVVGSVYIIASVSGGVLLLPLGSFVKWALNWRVSFVCILPPPPTTKQFLICRGEGGGGTFSPLIGHKTFLEIFTEGRQY